MPPWDYIRARVCKEFHCTPSALKKEDAEIYQLYQLLLEGDTLMAQRAKSPEFARG